jgi:hypothetical protein
MCEKFQEDFEFGINNEIDLLEPLRFFFSDDTIMQIENKYSRFDFKGDKKYIELKSRKCNSTTYPTTIVSFAKFNKVKDGHNYYCFFKFLDGIKYIEYDKNLFNTFEIKQVVRRDRGRIEKDFYYHIPIEKLSPLIL